MAGSKALLLELGRRIRAAAAPHWGREASRKSDQVAHSGDSTFTADVAAEEALTSFLQEQERPLACYSEDAGLRLFHAGSLDACEALLIVDPIDGTRPLLCGFEACTVSIALVPGGRPATLGEVAEGMVLEIPSGRAFYARRGHGAEEIPGVTLRPSARTDPEAMFCAFEAAGNPMADVMGLIGPIIDRTSITGGVFLWNSSAYALTRVAMGSLDAFLAVGAEILARNPAREGRFLEAGRGRVVGLFPYDIAAALLILQEAGGIATKADGSPLDDHPAMATGREGLLSCVAAGTAALHRALLERLS